MNVSYAWLRALAPGLTDPPEALAERLALLGAPVEGLERLGEGLGDIVVARVVEAGPHPNADRLSLCRVDAGTGEILSVVCGAPNVRSGGTYPFVPVGGTLPGGMEIRRAKIRGEVSNGMLCSPKELGMGVDHAGILELHGAYEPGSPFVEALGLDDARLDVEVTSNRGDLLSHVGVAREVAPGGVGGVALPPIPGAPALVPEWVTDTREVEVAGVRVRIEEPELCRRFLGAVVRGVRIGPSPDWLQTRLRAVGARPINNVVDATNYVLFELGHPTHAYDLAQLRGGVVVTRLAREGEPVETLDGIRRTLDPSMLVIADAERTVDVAGIMGEETSSVTEATTDVFLECAHFEPSRIRATRKALDIQSDAGYRFERFVDPEGQRRAFLRVLEVILATAGGELHPRLADVHPRPWSTPRIELRLARVERVLGVAFGEARVRELLEPLGFTVAAGPAGALAVQVPGWRGADVTREVDLIEEIARRHGFDAFPQELGPYRPTRVPDHPLFRLEDELRALLADLGLFEAQTPAFVPEAEGEIRLSNPLSREEPVLRRILLPSLLRRVERNLARGVRDVRLFELGTAFRRGDSEARPHEDTRLCAVLTGRRRPPHWLGADESLDLWDLKGLLETIVRHARPGSRLAPASPPSAVEGPEGVADPDAGWWMASESWTVVDGDGGPVGRGGRVEPRRLDLPPWAGAVFGLELTLPPAPRPRPDPAYRPLPTFPGVERDVALLVPDAVPAARVVEVARASGGALLADVDVFDLFRGAGVPAGVRSLAHRFRFRSPERTLTDDEVERAIRAILERLGEELGVHVRG
jgi:phenylalanyl-tRNA synthetase beta chain